MAKLTRQELVSGIEGLKNHLQVGNKGSKFETSSEDYQNTCKAIHVLEDMIDAINEEEGIVITSTPCRHTKKERKPRVKKVKVELKWNKANIKDLLVKNDTMVEKSIVKIYERQTADEQQTQSTNHENGIGFNGSDANIMSSFAKWVLSGKRLSPKQLDIARAKIMKYAGQLARIGNELEAEKENKKNE